MILKLVLACDSAVYESGVLANIDKFLIVTLPLGNAFLFKFQINALISSKKGVGSSQACHLIYGYKL